MASGDSASSPIAIASPASIPSIGSPCPTLAPRASPALQTQPENPGIITHKEWVVPPRPKPGRKPATDTPPTKRKAQNRAAQRAFRERRAARVNELEEQLKEVNSEAETRNQEFKDQIAQLTNNNTELAKENASLKLKIETLLRELEEANAAVAAVKTAKTELTQVASPAPSSGTADAPCGGDCSCQDLIDKALCGGPNAASIPSAKWNVRKQSEIRDLVGCGSCSKDGECACYNEATAVPLPKRATSPIANDPKRSRITVDYLEDLETDFTAAYMSRPVSSSGTPSSLTHMPDPCGFCSDGTPCVCAEMANAMDMEDSDTDEEQRDVKLAPILASGEFGILSPPSSSAGHSVPLRRMMGLDRPLPLHPPTGVRATLKTPTPPSSSTGCKPGGCDQCKADPMSTLFCQSVATRIQSSSSSGGCCGGNASGSGDCCKDIESAVPTPPKLNTRSKQADGKTYIPCSAVYQTLSRHRAFDDAAADLGALVRPLVIQSVDGRCPQVEVSSVRDVLKMLDRRFGRD